MKLQYNYYYIEKVLGWLQSVEERNFIKKRSAPTPGGGENDIANWYPALKQPRRVGSLSGGGSADL